MRSVPISVFKAKCIGILKEVQRLRQPIVVTLRGAPLATVQPALVAAAKRLGALEGKMSIHGDLVRAGTSADWEMLA